MIKNGGINSYRKYLGEYIPGVRIEATTPTRIDLAGGSLDLYPIYLLEDGALTINCAIDMCCTVTLETRSDKAIHIRSVDLGTEEHYENVDAISTTGPLEIVERAVRYFRPKAGLDVVTENRVRKGSGLGASSSLLIAALGALRALNESTCSSERMIDIAADLEAQCIRVPTGKQDYFAAVFGGVSALRFDVGGGKRECLLDDEEDVRGLERRLVLSFAGEPRFSGATNWSLIKNYIEGNPDTVAAIRRIGNIARGMRKCVIRRDWAGMASLMGEEWENRRVLAEGVSNERVDLMMSAALNAGALASKLCGAGGGGCMITFVDPEKRESVENALTDAGAEVIRFKILSAGMKLERLT
jgi:D-glycero-alpha-D-manno-heptose-7-phosphate kinase